MVNSTPTPATQFSHALSSILHRRKPRVYAVGTVGSGSALSDHGDLDVFAILTAKGAAPLEMKRAHKAVVSAVEAAVQRLSERDIIIGVFTEFRMEEFSRYLLRNGPGQQLLLVHLKVYPTLPSVGIWQSRPVARGYFANVASILYHSGRRRPDSEILFGGLALPSRREQLELLRSLAYEVIEYVAVSGLPERFIVTEGVNKLGYIAKYLSLCWTGEMRYEEVAAASWEDAVHASRRTPTPIQRAISYVARVRREGSQAPCSKDLMRVLYGVATLLDTKLSAS
jgi:hypothetical protein